MSMEFHKNHFQSSRGPDPDARRLIEEWAVRWHHDARERLGKTGPRLGWSCPVSAVIGRFARPVAPGFVQLSFGGESVNLDEGQVTRYGAMEAAYDPEPAATPRTRATPASTASSADCCGSSRRRRRRRHLGNPFKSLR